MPQPSSFSPLPADQQEGDSHIADGEEKNLRSAPLEPPKLQSSSDEKGPGQQQGPAADDGTDRLRLKNSLDLDLRLKLQLLSDFLASLPARWLSRQRVSDLGLSLEDLPVCTNPGVAAQDFPEVLEDEEGEGDGDGDEKGPTLALLATNDDADDEEALSVLGSIQGPAPGFQVLAACRDEEDAEGLAARLSSNSSSGGSRSWSWRPLAPRRSDLLLAQLFFSSSSSSSSSPSLLVASDYDHTLIDDNSDTLGVEALGASETLRALWKSGKTKAKEFGWTEAVDEALRAGARATARDRRDPEQVVCLAAASAPCSPALREALLAVCGKEGEEGPEKKKQNHFAIFSDANDVFIEEHSVSKKLNLSAVATNPGRFVDVPADGATSTTPAHRRLALSRATERYGPHSCPRGSCPANLCKGQLLAKLLVAGAPGAPFARGVLYLGDGGNDVCPAASCLGPLDAALVRERYGENGKTTAFAAAVLPSSSPSPNSSPSPPKTRLLCRSIVP